MIYAASDVNRYDRRARATKKELLDPGDETGVGDDLFIAETKLSLASTTMYYSISFVCVGSR